MQDQSCDKMITKIKILDTNVLLMNPNSLFDYPNELVILPIGVIKELDNFKKKQDQLGKHARMVSKKIVKLRKRGQILYKESTDEDVNSLGIPLNNGGRLKISALGEKLPYTEELTSESIDNQIIATALYYKNKYESHDVNLVTRDNNMLIIAEAHGVPSIAYENKTLGDYTDIYKGFHSIEVNPETYSDITKNKSISIQNLGELDLGELNPNEFVLIKEEGSKACEIRIVQEAKDGEKFLVVKKKHKYGFGINPKNTEQSLAHSLLMNPDIPLVTITGKAGTGKTLLAISAALGLIDCQSLFNENVQKNGTNSKSKKKKSGEDLLKNSNYDRISISRPVIPLGSQNIGFLKGDLKDKLTPWMSPLFDNLEFIFNSVNIKRNTPKKPWEELEEMGVLHIEPLSFIRGRSIPNTIMIIDEAQNLSDHEVKTIITRVGEGTKIIFTGDPNQIDNPYLDEQNNGLTYLIHAMKDDELMGHIHLEKGERSPLAEKVANKLK